MHVAGRAKRPRGTTAPPLGAADRPRGRRHPLRCPPLSAGRPSPPRGTAAPPSAVVGRMGLTAGIWRGVRRASRGSILRANLHNTAIERICVGRAVSRMPCMRSTARPRRIGSIVELCMPGAPRPVPGTTAPTLRCPPLSPGRRGTAPEETGTPLRCPPLSPGRRDPSPGTTAPTSRCPPLSPRSRDPLPGRPHPLQVPAVTPRTPRHRPVGNRHPTSDARRKKPAVTHLATTRSCKRSPRRGP